MCGEIMKKAKIVEEQLQILEKRGLVIENRDRAIEILRNINYYTLTGYFFPFKQGEKYQNGTSMNLAIKLYHFDNEIRNRQTLTATQGNQQQPDLHPPKSYQRWMQLQLSDWHFLHCIEKAIITLEHY